MNALFLLLILFGFVSPLLFMFIGFVVGQIIEQRHLKSLDEREAHLHHIGIVNLDPKTPPPGMEPCGYVDGQAVIGADFFKSRISRFRNFFGGEMKTLSRVMARARREAIVRMLEKADAVGATQVWNVRLESSQIAGGENNRKTGQNATMAEIHAYGTAVRMRAGA